MSSVSREYFSSLLAQADVEAALDYYCTEAAHPASGLIDALEEATAHIQRHPGTGSLRYAHELNLAQLRYWPLTRYPYALFYIEHDDHVHVIRVVHMSRDIPPTLHAALGV